MGVKLGPSPWEITQINTVGTKYGPKYLYSTKYYSGDQIKEAVERIGDKGNA
jgi:hypothetical protein